MKSTQKQTIIVFITLTIVSMCFIFSNSLQTATQSSAQSGSIIELIKPILDPHGLISLDTFTFLVRKAAHMTEFGILGLCLGGLGISLSNYLYQKLVFPWLFLSLATAVTDEFLQYFSPGRSSEVRDVLVDFSGACLGLLCSLLIYRIIKHLHRK